MGYCSPTFVIAEAFVIAEMAVLFASVTYSQLTRKVANRQLCPSPRLTSALLSLQTFLTIAPILLCGIMPAHAEKNPVAS